MTKTSSTPTEHALFHPAAHYDSPDDVLNDRQLSDAEKRVVLSSWASDIYAVESSPALRDVPGIGHSIRLADILAALRRLNSEDDDPAPRGGAAIRWRRPRWTAALSRRSLPC
ncbi:hypothetical protein LJR220_003907 [Bradyrhizobium sp. LjRoot220]|uniref:hypothetical protein n=1 Tax=Bradyrhizobium sp. LjRoot220 TaxID=3342284 RepID=UPI003ECDBDBE